MPWMQLPWASLPPMGMSCVSSPVRPSSATPVASAAMSSWPAHQGLPLPRSCLPRLALAPQRQHVAASAMLMLPSKLLTSRTCRSRLFARVNGLEKRLSATKEEVEGIEERLVSLAGLVEGLLSGFETLTKKFELMSESIKPALETTMEDVAELTAHRAKTSERYMRVNRDLAIVEVDLKVALDELRLYDDFEERLAAAREKSWAHYAKEQGSIAYPDSFLSKS
ncbi:hypothetical protein BCR44DRAFT_1440036 [Catenaria anguillulae PL171]|uniref:Uncharacterized protein n=1 Tax=Catenaria anguillulae PL171 TaxID=765915 RepID=A0A1Y2HHG8_9FUNG|nr:hypothetical protein BCR44DRAFT_1440036 [Catenaria anguillulae PL171]